MTGAEAALRRRVDGLTAAGRQLLAERLRGTPAQRLVAWVVTGGTEAAPAQAADLESFLRTRLPEYMVPSAFILLDELPRLPNGKVDVGGLTGPTRALTPAGFESPRDPVEAALADIWAHVLAMDRVGRNDNFFELGGDSILSIQVVARARRAGIVLRPDQIFEHQTLAQLAAAAGSVGIESADAALDSGSLPLTPIQAWFFEQELPEFHHWHQVVRLEVPAAASTAEAAVQAVVRHHPALRLRFARGPAGWEQTIAEPTVHVPFRLVGLSHVAPAEVEHALAGVEDQLAAATDLENGPPLGAALVELGSDRSPLLVIAIHHLVVDAVSWGILLEDLASAYGQLLRGQEVALPRAATSLPAWSRALRRAADSGRFRGELDFWRESGADAASLPIDHAGTWTEATAQSVAFSLDAAETRMVLHDANAAYHTRPDDLLLTALMLAISPWTGQSRLLVGVERHGREALGEELDLSRTVGWFTSYFPVLLALEPHEQPGPALKSVKEQLRRVPDRGVGYGVLRYSGLGDGVAEALRSLPQPAVIFNYTGRVDPPGDSSSLLRPVGLPHPSRGPLNRRPHLLELNAFVADGHLHCQWVFSATVHERATIEQLAARYLAALRALVSHCVAPQAGGYTPSDFPDAGLSQDELDRFLEGLEP